MRRIHHRDNTYTQYKRTQRWLAVLLLAAVSVQAKAQEEYTWWSPAENTFAYFRFSSNATDIVVRYVLQQSPNNNHSSMPVAAASGIDLYAIDHNGNWVWLPGESSFGDTIVYRYHHLAADPAYAGKDVECRLFLPLANTVRWMQVGVPSNNHCTPLPLQPEKPIVVYGPGNAGNAIVSRPGLGWLPALERKLDRPFVQVNNTSGEQAALDAATALDAKLYVLDCLPGAGAAFDTGKIKTQLFTAVKAIRAKHPAAPVVLSTLPAASADTVYNKEIQQQNAAVQAVFARLMEQHVQNIHILTANAAALNGQYMADSRRLNELGAAQYAAAMEQAIRIALHEPQGNTTTTVPVVQSRDGLYNWRSRHAEVLALNKTKPPANIILANSIVHYWGGLPKGPFSRGEDSWNTYLEPLGVRNLGFGWDKIENVLWRIYHDELDGYDAKHVLVMIGTNNLGSNTDDEILEGLQLLVQAIRLHQPQAQVLLSALLPRRNMEPRVAQLNNRIAALAAAVNAGYINPGKLLLNSQGKIEESYFGDGLHPNAAGYAQIAPVLAEALKDK